ALKKLLQALFDERKQPWEHEKDYSARMAKASAYREALYAYERAFNAEAYHLNQSELLGYISVDALQVAFGEQVYNFVGSGVRRITTNTLLNQFNSVENLIEKAGTLDKCMHGARQGFIKGN